MIQTSKTLVKKRVARTSALFDEHVGLHALPSRVVSLQLAGVGNTAASDRLAAAEHWGLRDMHEILRGRLQLDVVARGIATEGR